MREEIVTRINKVVANITAVESIPPDVVLQGHEGIDSLDTVEIAMAVEEEFELGLDLEPAPDWTIAKIADAVIARKEPTPA